MRFQTGSRPCTGLPGAWTKLAIWSDLQRSRNVLPAQAQSLEQRLDKSAERASAQLDVSSSALEAIYIQMQLVAAKGADSRRLRQLREEIAGHAQSLSGLNDEIAESIEQIAERSSP